MKAFFVAYHSAFEEISRSQVLPYLVGLSRYGIEFRLISFEKSPLDTKAADALEQELSSHNIRWTRLWYRKKPRLLAKFFDHLIGTLMICLLILKHRPDIVHMRGVMACLSALLPCKLFRKKALFDVRGELADEYVGGGLLKDGSLTYKLLKNFQRLCYRCSDQLVVLTNAHMLRLLSSGIDKKVTVIPCCVDTDKFLCHPDVPVNDRLKGLFVLVYHGKIATWYKFDEMLDFLHIARQAIPNVHLLILTSTPQHEFYHRIAGMKLEDHVTVIHPKFDEIPVLLLSCKAGLMFINPYKKFASSPIKLGECLACGLPVIINSGIGDTEGFLREQGVGVIVRSFDRPAYWEAITSLLALQKDPDLPRRCRDTAMSELPLSFAIENYNRIYRSLGGFHE